LDPSTFYYADDGSTPLFCHPLLDSLGAFLFPPTPFRDPFLTGADLFSISRDSPPQGRSKCFSRVLSPSSWLHFFHGFVFVLLGMAPFGRWLAWLSSFSFLESPFWPAEIAASSPFWTTPRAPKRGEFDPRQLSPCTCFMRKLWCQFSGGPSFVVSQRVGAPSGDQNGFPSYRCPILFFGWVLLGVGYDRRPHQTCRGPWSGLNLVRPLLTL